MLNRGLAGAPLNFRGFLWGASVTYGYNHKLSGFGRLKIITCIPNHQVPTPAHPWGCSHPPAGQSPTPHTHLFLRGALFRGYLGCLRSRSVLGLRKVGDVRIFFFLWLWTPFRTAFLAFSAFAFASVFGGTAVRRAQSAPPGSAGSGCAPQPGKASPGQ